MPALCCINRGFESHCRLICFQLFSFQNSAAVNAYDTADVAVKTIYLVRGYWQFFYIGNILSLCPEMLHATTYVIINLAALYP